MTSVKNPYTTLYTNLKNRFTVIHEGNECTLGECMLARAGKRSTSTSSLPVTTPTYERSMIATIVDFVSDKLTVKNPPVKDQTIKRFPFRTSASALLSAVATCALVLSCGIFALLGSGGVSPFASSDSRDSGYVETVEPDVDENEEILIQEGKN